MPGPSRSGQNRSMAVRTDCRHYSTRTVGTGEVIQRCRLGAAELTPFACPQGCLFFEDRPIGFGWATGDEPIGDA
jgi:hypothetical protein